MRIAFAGTPEFAARALDALIAAGHEIALVLTQPDRPAGRGLKARPSAVKVLALQHGLPLAQPGSLRDAAARAPIEAARVEVMVVAAYGLILPSAVLETPRLGCVNIHASLLPRWRGAAPIQRAIAAGDSETGITLMRMDAGLDTGDILGLYPLGIGPEETAGELHQRLAELGARAIVELLPRLTAGTVRATPQDPALATYAAKIDKAEARIDWHQPAAVLDRMIRAFDPFPGAQAGLAGQPLKIWRARPAPGMGEPGTVLHADAQGVRVACGEAALDLIEVQKAGGRRIPVAAFLAGHPLAAGERLT